ncbi:MAG: MATE family efflux transporter [Bacteroidota bacterium]
MRKFIALFIQAVKGTETDFTKGSINKAVFLLAIPMILEMIMEGIFSIVDAILVSKVGEDAFATVVLTETFATLIYSLAIGVSIAATAMVGRRVGEKNHEAANEAAGQAVLLGVSISIIITIIGLLFPAELLRIMGASESVIATGINFTRIFLGSNIVIMLLFILNGVFRGAGNAAIAMRVLILANLLNIVLDFILIFGWGPIPAMGVTGAAIATSIGRGSAVLYQLYVLFSKKGIVQLTLDHLRSNWEVLKNLVNVAATGASQHLIGSASWIFLMMLIADYGTETVNGYGMAIRIIMFTFLPAWGIANAGATLIGQNLGAGQPERAEKSVWRAGYLNMAFLSAVAIIYLIWAEFFIRIFTNNPVVIEVGIEVLRVFSVSYPLFALGMVIMQAFGGAGDTRTPTMINFFVYWIFQIPLAYSLAKLVGWEASGVYWALVITEFFWAGLAIYLFRQGKWKTVEI